MKILVTGNSGYIGSHLTKLLIKDHEVFGLDITDPIINVTHINSDIRHNIHISEKFDCIIHLAALVRVNESNSIPIDYYNTNLTGTLNILNGLSTKNFIFASTGSAELCSNPYGTSKRAAEDCVREFCSKHNVPYTIFRFFNVIGSSGIAPTNPDGLFFNLIKAKDTKTFSIYGTDYNTPDGTAIRDYVHVDEICYAIIDAIKNPSNSIENLGHGVGYSVNEIVNIFKKVNNVEFEVQKKSRRTGDLECSVLDKPSNYMKKIYTIESLLKYDQSIS